MIKKNKSLGQYFTPVEVAEFMVHLIDKPKSAKILEPCAGEGVFLTALTKNNFNNIKAMELDSTLKNKSNTAIKYGDFLESGTDEKFDVIIGNPPYVRWKNIPKETQERLKNNPKWKDKLNGLSDLLYYFIYLSVEKLNAGGELIFITPLFWTSTFHSRLLRKYLCEIGVLETFITFDEIKIFEDVSTNTLIFKFVKEKKDIPINIVHAKGKGKLTKEILVNINQLLKRLSNEEYIQDGSYQAYTHPQFVNSNPWKSLPPTVEPLINRIESSCTVNSPIVEVTNHEKVKLLLADLLEDTDIEELGLDTNHCKKVKFLEKTYYLYQNNINTLTDFDRLKSVTIKRYARLGDIADIGNGMVSGLDKAFQIEDESAYRVEERDNFIRVIKAKNLDRYFMNGSTPYIFIDHIRNEKELDKLPAIRDKLRLYKEELNKRYSYNREIPYWHWVFPRNKELIETNKVKIIVPCKERVDSRGYIRFGLAEGNFYASQDVTAIVKKSFFKEDERYLLAILNSNFIFNWLKHKGLSRGGVLEFSEKPLSMIPIRFINWENKEEVLIHNRIVELVTKILSCREYRGHIDEIETLLKKLYCLK